MPKLNFGTGGIPLTTKNRTTLEGIKRLEELGLNHMELEFVYSVYLKQPEAEKVQEYISNKDFTLSVHGSYFTNFAATDTKKWHASIYRLVKAAEMGELAGAKSITFHSGFFTGKTVAEVESRVIEGLTKAITELEEKGIKQINIAPELTGKPSQFGSVEELVDVIKKFPAELRNRISMCIDFAHNHARSNGQFDKVDDYKKFFDYLIKELGEKITDNLHMHMSAIEFTPKGEKNHLTFLDSFAAYKDVGIDLPEMEPFYQELKDKNRLGGGKQDWKGLMKVLKEYEIGGFLVCESPNLEHDALLMQKIFDNN